MPTKATKAPAELGPNGARLWRSVIDLYDLEVSEELVLLQACRTADRLDLLATEAANSPITVVNMKGDQVTHPAVVESRQASITLTRLIASLRLPQGDSGGMVRPQRRGSARGTYGLRRVQ